MRVPPILIFTILATYTRAWRTCDEQSFCSNLRHNHDTELTYSLANLVLNDDVTANLVNDKTKEVFNLRLVALQESTLRITVQDPNNPRYSPEDALDGKPTEVPLSVVSSDNDASVLSTGDLLLYIYHSPFGIEVLKNEEIIVQINKADRLVINTSENDQSLAIDVTFPKAQRAYGIPQHAEKLSLPSTGPGGDSAFRLFNVDYYGYPTFTRESLYGAIPILYGVSTTRTSGILWLNAAQTFVDINNSEDGVDSLFISETGALELFVFGGPTLKDCVRQYTKLTGVGQLPQYFTLGYHQSRYSYMSQEDVETVVAEFDNHNFPMDVIWLDIDYTYGYRYFTWNYTAFPQPIEMQNNVVATGRKMVAIIDPHIKVDPGYHVYDQGLAQGFFVKNPDGSVFEGVCWPGLSSYVDYFDSIAQEWYGNLYLLENFIDTTLNLYIWNDMNEPSVFELEDQTMPPNLLHYGGWQHKDVHNMYGLKHVESTFGGLLRRDPTKRPFILTRAHFVGSQRFSAMWTGDNVPSWDHLKISIPMVLTESLAGMAFCGADIGGFTGNVEDELLQRWYQAGAWYPFYRGHSGADTDRREPYLFSDEIQKRIRRSLRIRYQHIPYWYTLFFEHELTGDPIVRPLSYQYLDNESILDIDDQWLVGSDILVAPVLEEGLTKLRTYFPGNSSEYWYDLEAGVVYQGGASYQIDVDMDSAPYYYRGGSIILRNNDEVPSTDSQKGKGYTMYVCLNSKSEAQGNFYYDDWESFDYKSKQYDYIRFGYANEVLSSEVIHTDAEYTGFNVDKIFIYRVSYNSKTRDGKLNIGVTAIDEKFSIGKISKNVKINVSIA